MSNQSTITVALCSYSPSVGWRVVGISQSNYNNVSIFRFGQIKLLRIPLRRMTKIGYFCNPRKLLNV